MKLTSTSFENGGIIPKTFTCDGENTSPDLIWTGAPADAKSFALVLNDPDAARAGGFTHWVLYDIPADVDRLPSGVPRDEVVPNVGIQGKNDAGKTGYTGPCPPSGSHRYVFKLYALRIPPEMGSGATRKELQDAIKDQVLAEAELTVTYARERAMSA